MKEFITDLLTKINNSLNKKQFNLMNKSAYVNYWFTAPTESIRGPKANSLSVTTSANYLTADTSNKTITLQPGIYLLNSSINISPIASFPNFETNITLETENEVHIFQTIYASSKTNPNDTSSIIYKTDIIKIPELTNFAIGCYSDYFTDGITIIAGYNIIPLVLL